MLNGEKDVHIVGSPTYLINGSAERTFDWVKTYTREQMKEVMDNLKSMYVAPEGISRTEELRILKKAAARIAKDRLDPWVKELLRAEEARWFTLTFRNVNDQLPGRMKVAEAAELALKFMGTGENTRVFIVEEEGEKPHVAKSNGRGPEWKPGYSTMASDPVDYCDNGTGRGRRHLHGIAVLKDDHQGYRMAMENHKYLYGFVKEQGSIDEAIVTYLVKYLLKSPDARFWYKGGKSVLI